MTNNKSHTTEVIALRIPIGVVNILKRRAEKQGISVMEYTRKRLVYDTMRRHGQ